MCHTITSEEIKEHIRAQNSRSDARIPPDAALNASLLQQHQKITEE